MNLVDLDAVELGGDCLTPEVIYELVQAMNPEQRSIYMQLLMAAMDLEDELEQTQIYEH